MAPIIAMLIGFLCTFVQAEAFARWIKFEEARRIYTADIEDVRVNKDGSYITEYRRTFIVNTEEARQDLDVLDITYDAALERVEVLEAFVVNGNERVAVPKHLISELGAAGSAEGMDQSRIIKIALPNVRVGTVVDYKVRRHRFKTLLNGLFSDNFNLGYFATRKGAVLRIKSEIPLQVKIYGPSGYIKEFQRKRGNVHEYEFSLVRDSVFLTTNESEYPNWSPEPMYPSIQVTSLRDWSEMVGRISPQLEAKLSADLPPRYRGILERAAQEKSFSDKMDSLAAGINSELRYLGDWRESEDYYFPRNLADTAERGFGDCKDFSLLMVKMARVLGYSAHLALVQRGERNFQPTELPMPTYFNHMIAQVVDAEGGIHWLDPTNTLSQSAHIRSDIAGRPALLLSKQTRKLSTTPGEMPEHNILSLSAKLDYRQNGRLRIELELAAKGEFARSVIRGVAKRSKQQRREFILRLVSADRPLVSADYEVEETPQFLLRPVRLKANVELSDSPVETTAGFAIPVSRDSDLNLTFPAEEMVLGVKIGETGTRIQRSTYLNSQLVGSLPQNCHVESKWISLSRKFVANENEITVESTVVTITPYISNEELKSKSFTRLKEQIRECMKDRMIIFKKSAE